MAQYSVPSQEEMDALRSGDRSVFPGGEDYILKILEIKSEKKPDFNKNLIDQFVIKFSVESFADGAELEDYPEGKPVQPGQWIWKDIDPSRMGFKQDGTASLGRQFFLAANGISDLTTAIPSGDTAELVGGTLIGTLIVKKNAKGNLVNNITQFKTASRRRGRAAAPEASPSPTATTQRRGAVDSEEVRSLAVAAAKLTNDTDEPSAEQIAEAMKLFES